MTIWENAAFSGHEQTETPQPQLLTVFRGIQAAVKFKLNRADLAGVKVAVQGVGGVGGKLCHHLRGCQQSNGYLSTQSDG